MTRHQTTQSHARYKIPGAAALTAEETKVSDFLRREQKVPLIQKTEKAIIWKRDFQFRPFRMSAHGALGKQRKLCRSFLRSRQVYSIVRRLQQYTSTGFPASELLECSRSLRAAPSKIRFLTKKKKKLGKVFFVVVEMIIQKVSVVAGTCTGLERVEFFQQRSGCKSEAPLMMAWTVKKKKASSSCNRAVLRSFFKPTLSRIFLRWERRRRDMSWANISSALPRQLLKYGERERSARMRLFCLRVYFSTWMREREAFEYCVCKLYCSGLL